MRTAEVSSNRSFKRAYLRLASTNWPETGFGAISLQLNDHTVRGVGGRQYGTSKDIEALKG